MEVIYARDGSIGDGFQAYTGRMQWEGGVYEFEGTHFEELLRAIHDRMPPEDEVLTFLRVDRENLKPHPLDPALIFLIKTNVEEAISKMAYPKMRIELGRTPPAPSMLTSCTDTLAGAFGEEVLVRTRWLLSTTLPLVECPGCGKWVDVTLAKDPDGDDLTATYTANCLHCDVWASFKPVNATWAAVRVSTLLHTPLTKFFLPRAWNGFKPWISKDDLRERLISFLKDKEKFDAS